MSGLDPGRGAPPAAAPGDSMESPPSLETPTTGADSMESPDRSTYGPHPEGLCS